MIYTLHTSILALEPTTTDVRTLHRSIFALELAARDMHTLHTSCINDLGPLTWRLQAACCSWFSGWGGSQFSWPSRSGLCQRRPRQWRGTCWPGTCPRPRAWSPSEAQNGWDGVRIEQSTCCALNIWWDEEYLTDCILLYMQLSFCMTKHYCREEITFIS